MKTVKIQTALNSLVSVKWILAQQTRILHVMLSSMFSAHTTFFFEYFLTLFESTSGLVRQKATSVKVKTIVEVNK